MKKYKRFIAIILCITIIFSIDNFVGLGSIFKYISNSIVTKAEEITSGYNSDENNQENDRENNQENNQEEDVTDKTEVFTEPVTELEETEEMETSVAAENFEQEVTEEVTVNAPEEYVAGGDVNVSDATEFLEGQTYFIKTYSDWNRLAEVSQESSLKGVTFIVYKRDSQYDNWTLTNLKIGNEDYPFAGTIYSYYTSTIIYSNVVLFDYLSSNARIGTKTKTGIKYFIISYNANVTSGLATNLVIDKKGCNISIGGNGLSSYYVILKKATINASTVAGGLFSKVYIDDKETLPEGTNTPEYTINFAESLVDASGSTGIIDLSGVSSLNINNENMQTISGSIAGGYIGEVTGNIDINISGFPKQIVRVNSSVAAGGLIGKISEGVNIVFTNTSKIELTTNVTSDSGDSYSGGLVGYMENSSIICEKELVRKGNTRGRKYVGSLIGYAYNSSCIIKNYTLGNNIYIYEDVQGASNANRAVGGVIGMYLNEEADTNDVLELSYINTEHKNATSASGTRISTYNLGYNVAGGLVGIIGANNAKVRINNINTDTAQAGKNSLVLNMVYKDNYYNINGYDNTLAESGGIAGSITGMDVVVENIVFNYKFINAYSGRNSNTLSGRTVGNIAARVGEYNSTAYTTRMIVKDVTVLDSYIYHVKDYHGGLFGYVRQSAVALQGKIDLSGVPYVTWANSIRYNQTNVNKLLASFRNRGFITGSISTSIIFLDMDAEYIRPITYDENGVIEQFNADTLSEYTAWDNNNTNSKYLYCIDDIGNYSSLFKNVENVIDIKSTDIRNLVQGKLEKDADGYYIIGSLGDALRLAIAGSALESEYSRYARDVIDNDSGESMPLNDILALNYRVTVDLPLGNAGIKTFVGNSVVGSYYFSGIFEGVKKADGTNPVITLDSISKQMYCGLFPTVKNAEFRNIDINGNLFYSGGSNYNTLTNNHIRAGAGSIAAYAIGNINIDNVNIYTNIKDSINQYTSWDDDNGYCYGGMFGIYDPQGEEFNCTNSVIAPSFSVIRANAHNGGMIGWVICKNGSTLSNMNISNCTLSTKMVSNDVYTGASHQTQTAHARLGGLISMISDSYSNVSYTQYVNNRPFSSKDAVYGKININNLAIKNANIDLTTTYRDVAHGIRVTGGLLGYAWKTVDVNIDTLSVDNSAIKSKGCVGGLLSYAEGSYYLKNINLNSFKMAHVNNYGSYPKFDKSGFLFGNGQNAFITIDGYNIAKDGNVTYENYDYFDEIVGINLRIANKNGHEYISDRNLDVDLTYKEYGIVNIINSNFKNFDDSQNYESYVNQVVQNTNKYTRYYYNLFDDIDEDDFDKDYSLSKYYVTVDGNTAVVEKPEQWLTLNVAANSSSFIKSHFNKYLSNKSIAGISKISLNSDLDMKGYSFYPISMNKIREVDGKGHKITLYGENVADLEDGLKTAGKHSINRTNENKNIAETITTAQQNQCTQHYLMHAALFNEVIGTVTINNLELSGTVANVGADSGALISGAVYGTVSINNIKLSDLRISNYNEGAKVKCGLMVSRIGVYSTLRQNANANVTFDGISTEYTNDSNLPAASALIGYVGTNTATNSIVKFKNMRLEDEKNADASAGKVFQYASFVYSYKYTEDPDKNKCYMVYTFKKNDCKTDVNNVTYGEEIKANVEYADLDRDKTDATDPLNIAITEAKNGKYIPYVFTERNIFVNPRNGNLTEGCGTYEDPYKITNVNQFLTLYLYLTGKPDYKDIFESTGVESEMWHVVPVGGNVEGDGSECCNNGTTEKTHTAVSFNDKKKFPTRDQLRTAYYEICTDLSLGDSTDMNNKYIAGEFCGLGSSEYPFAGVIVGKEQEDGTYPTILIPEQGRRIEGSNNIPIEQQITQSTLGLIQYMSGAVVKDINIASENPSGHYNVSGSGGGVAAIVVGGDSIIDNVNVSLNFNTNKLNYTKSRATVYYYENGIGGLVGMVKDGSVILRNIQDKKVVGDCNFEGYEDIAVATSETAMIVERKFEEFLRLFSPAEDEEIMPNSLDTYTGEYEGYVGMLVGRVYDGYVLYDGYKTGVSGEDGPAVLKRNELIVSDKYKIEYPLVNGFHIINGNVMKSASEKMVDSVAENNRFKIERTDKNYTATIKNAEQLELLSLALNSDAFSVYYCEDVDKATGYGYKARSRKASYLDIGKAGAVSSEDRSVAVTYDDGKVNSGYIYPYICYNYIDYTSLTDSTETDFDKKNYEGYKTTFSTFDTTQNVYNDRLGYNENVTRTNYAGNINKTIPESADYTTTYVLEEKTDDKDKFFDLTEYGISFRGIGAIYTKTYSDFRASFNGNGNTIKFKIDRTFDEDIMYSGLFNELVYNQKVINKNVSDTQLEIKNFNIKNSVVYNPNKFSEIDLSDNNQSRIYINDYGLNICASGMVAGVMSGAWKLEDIVITRNEAFDENDKIQADVSGYRSLGGFVGRINNTLSISGFPTDANMNTYYSQSNDIDFINCKVNGKDDNVKFKVTELGSTETWSSYAQYKFDFAGGFVGGIGANVNGNDYTQVFGKVDFIGCDIDYLKITLENRGYAGGFAGHIGQRWSSNNFNNAERAAIGEVNVDGSFDNGITVKSVSTISNMEIESKNNDDNYSLGGVFGRVELPTRIDYPGGSLDIRNFQIKNIKLYNEADTTVNNLRDRQYEGDGGVIGYTRSFKANLYNITLSDSEIGYITSGKETGGLIGNIKPTGNTQNYINEFLIENTLNIDNCHVNNTKVVSNCGIVGGMIGQSNIKKLYIGSESTSNTVNNCDIIASMTINNQSTAAGGAIGYVDMNGMGGRNAEARFEVYVKNLTVTDTNVTGGVKGTGGAIGTAHLAQNQTSTLDLNNVYVYSTGANGRAKIEGQKYAGGIVGALEHSFVNFKMDGHMGVGTYYDTDKKSWAEDLETNKSDSTGLDFKAQYTGGIVGYENSRYSNNYNADIYVANNKIYSYINNGNTDNSIHTYSGGLYGYKFNVTNSTDKYNTITVKDNLIFTGANNVISQNRALTTVGCGGLFGRINSEEKVTTYLPDITLINNSIGYYDGKIENPTNDTTINTADKISDRKRTLWNTFNTTSREIKLYDATNTSLSSVSWDEIEDLNDNNIANYSKAIGTFIGYQEAAKQTSQIFILSPKVIMDETVGSIPVVDVGMNGWTATANQSTTTYGTGSPYQYRTNCHIVYMDEVGDDYKDITAPYTYSSTSENGETVTTDRMPKYIVSALIGNELKEYNFGEFEQKVTEYQNLNKVAEGEKELTKAKKNYNFITAKRLNIYMPYNDENIKYSLCTGDNTYYNLTYTLLNKNGSRENIKNGVPVLILDGLNPQSVGDYAALILTNGGGAVSGKVITDLKNAGNNTMKDFWNISCENAYIDIDGTIKPIESTDTRFSNHKITSIQVSDSNRLKLASSIYDEIIPCDGGSLYTITLLCYTYKCPKADGTSKVEKLYIPVFVKEKVTMDSYIRILSNEEYSLKELTTGGYKDEVHISHGSTYTIYAEFIYDAIRLKDSFKNYTVKKTINFKSIAPGIINAGTKLTLIDLSTGKAYYKTAKGNEMSNTFSFDDFRDENDNPYTHYKIGTSAEEGGIPDHMLKSSYTSIGYLDKDKKVAGKEIYKNVALERFLIVVEPPESENTSTCYLNIDANAVFIDENNEATEVNEFFNMNMHKDDAVKDANDTGLYITYVPGPTIGFGGIDELNEGTPGITYISGQISQDRKVTLDANIEVKLKDEYSPYWDEKVKGNIIDSANSGKYIEVAVTLLDKETGDVVAWPSGTNVSFNGGNKQILTNNLIIYMYKDIGKQFPMNPIQNNITGTSYYYNINESIDSPDMKWLYKDESGDYFYYVYNSQNEKFTPEYPGVTNINETYMDISNQCKVELDFSKADLEEYSGKEYTVMMKLYRSDSPIYPNAGGTNTQEDESKRQYSDNVVGESIRELAASIEPDNMLDLGINLYNNEKTEHKIPFTSKLDFSDLIYTKDAQKEERDLNACAKQKYMVTYRIYKKVLNESGTTDSGNGNMVTGYNDDIASEIIRSNDYKYEIMDWDDSPFSLYDDSGTKLNTTEITVNVDQQQKVIVMEKEFTADEIKAGIVKDGSNAQKVNYVTNWGGNLHIKSGDMADTDLTNYMITATYLPYDKTAVRPENDQNQTLFDFFVFTIAELKTDF